MRNADTYLHNLPLYQSLDRLNAQLTQAITVAKRPTFSHYERAWFRSPIKEGK